MEDQITEEVVAAVPGLEIVVSDDNIADIKVSFNTKELEPYKKQFIIEKRKSVILRGFRKGTAPESMVAKFFAEEAKETAKNSLMFAKYTRLLQEHKLQPLTQPKLEKLIEENDDFHANLSVEVLQPIVLGQYLGLELKKAPERQVESSVAKTLSDIKSNYQKIVELPDAVVENGKMVVVDFAMSIDGVETEKQVDIKMVIGSGLFYADFESNVIGMKAGDTKEFVVNFPDTYQKDELKSKAGSFVLSVKSVNELTQYTDDELAVVLNYADGAKMLEAITAEIEAKYKNEEHLWYENQILGILGEAHQFKLPKSLVENEIKKIITEKPETTPEQAAVIADQFVRTDLILGSINEKHPDLQLTEEEFRGKVAELATKAKDSVDGVVAKLQTAGKLQSYITYLRNCKVIDMIIEMADIKEVDAAKAETTTNTTEVGE